MYIEVKRSPKSSLNFTKIIKTTDLTGKLSREIIENLKSDFEFGYKNDKYEGFYDKFIFNDDKSCDLDFLVINEEYNSIKNQTIHYNENNKNHVTLYKLNYVIGTNGGYDHFVDFFFIPDFELIIINGSKSDIEKAYEKFNECLIKIKDNSKKNFNFCEINFSSDFLLWLIYKKTIKNKISDELSVDRFLDFSTDDFPNEKGLYNPDRVPRTIATKNSDNMITLPIIYGLLNNRDFSQLSGKFQYMDNDFEIQINVNPSVNPKSDIFVRSVYSIKGENYCNKIKLTIPFINNLIDLYLTWRNFDSQKKIS